MRPVRILPEPCRSVFGPGFSAGPAPGSVSVTNQLTEVTAAGLSEDAGQVLGEGTDGGALLLPDDIRAALDAVLGGPEWRQAEAERLLSYDASARALGILGGTGVTLPLATTGGAGLMSAADKQALAAAGGGLATETTRAAIASTEVDAGVLALRTNGHLAPGDGGGGLYVRAAGEPAHGAKVQSADGAWWALVPEGGRVNLLQFGAPRTADGTAPAADSYAAIAAALDYARLWSAAGQGAALAVEVPAGRYLVGQTLQIRAAVHLRGLGGRPEFLFPDTAGIVIHDSRTALSGAETPDDPATTGARGAVIEGLALTGPSAGQGFQPGKPGLRAHARCTLRSLAVSGFSGHGVQIEAEAAVDADATGWTVLDLAAAGNGGSGLHVAGAADAGRALGLRLSGNGRWGLEDRTARGSTYAGVESAGNGTAAAGQGDETALVERGGDVWAAAAAASEAALAATEPGTDPAVWRLAHPGGGDIGWELAPAWSAGRPAGTYVTGGAARIEGAENASALTGLFAAPDQGPPALDARALAAGGRIGAVAPGGTGTGLALSGPEVAAGSGLRFAGEGVELRLADAPDAALALVTAGTPAGLALARDTATGSLGWQADGATAEALTLSETTLAFGRPEPVGAAQAWFPRGVFLGAAAEARSLAFGPDAGAGADHGAGDVVLASAPAEGAPAGWLWLSQHDADGAPGTARALWQVPTLDGAVTLPGLSAAALAAEGAAGHAGTLAWQTDRAAAVVSDGSAWRDLRALPVVEKPGNAVLSASEAFAVIRMTSAGDNTLTVEAGTLAPGEHVTVVQSGSGRTRLVAGAGVSIESETTLALRARHAAATLLCLAPDSYLLVGSLAES